MINPSDGAGAAAAHAALEPGETLGTAMVPASAAGDGTQQKRRGRPPLKPGQKGKYQRRAKSERPADAKAPRASRTKAPKDDQPAKPNRAQRGKNGGWLRIGGWGDTSGGRTPTVLRDKARDVLAELGYPELANIITDPDAKDADKLRAIDILMKASVGYMTPEQAMGEDAPELPPPIFNTTEGELPGNGADALPTDEAGDDGDQSRGAPSDGSGPLPFPVRGTPEAPEEPSGPMPYAGGM